MSLHGLHRYFNKASSTSAAARTSVIPGPPAAKQKRLCGPGLVQLRPPKKPAAARGPGASVTSGGDPDGEFILSSVTVHVL